MTEAVDHTAFFSRPDWQAEAHYGYSIVSVNPESDDALVAAIDEMVAQPQQRYWTLQYLHSNERTGWDVYLLQRLDQPALPSVPGLVGQVA